MEKQYGRMRFIMEIARIARICTESSFKESVDGSCLCSILPRARGFIPLSFCCTGFPDANETLIWRKHCDGRAFM